MKNPTLDQQMAILADDKTIVAIAGPGSGKTATLVARITRLLDSGILPAEIVALTYTNAAANELRNRLIDAERTRRDLDSGAEDPEIDLGFVGTRHSFALRMLKEHGAAFGYGARVALISPESALDLLQSKAKTLGCKAPIAALLGMKAAGVKRTPGAFDLATVTVLSYLDDMKAGGIVDYDILLQEFEELLRVDAFADAIEKRFTHFFADEVQDNAPGDWRIDELLPIRHKCFVGDPDQAIYSFRGGRVREMLAAAERPGTLKIVLAENFRSHSEICEAAQRLIERNRVRFHKETRSVRGPGGSVTLLDASDTDGEEVARVIRRIKELYCYGRPSIAVLARTNDTGALFREGLAGAGIEVVEAKRSNLPADWARARAIVELCVAPDNDALAFFYLVADGESVGRSPKAARTIAHAARKDAAAAGISLNAYAIKFSAVSRGESVLAVLQAYNVSRESRAIIAEQYRELGRDPSALDLSLAVAQLRNYYSEGEGDGVRVMTIHAAKGREFDAVFVVGFEDESIPGRAGGLTVLEDAKDALEEERRLAYVAITRARQQLFLSFSRSRVSKWGGNQGRRPSRFLREILDPSIAYPALE